MFNGHSFGSLKLNENFPTACFTFAPRQTRERASLPQTDDQPRDGPTTFDHRRLTTSSVVQAGSWGTAPPINCGLDSDRSIRQTGCLVGEIHKDQKPAEHVMTDTFIYYRKEGKDDMMRMTHNNTNKDGIHRPFSSASFFFFLFYPFVSIPSLYSSKRERTVERELGYEATKSQPSWCGPKKVSGK